MGYNTEFNGHFRIDREADDETYDILEKLHRERHESDGGPSYYCQWLIDLDRKIIYWDGGEKFYEYVPWIKYIVDKVLKPRGYVLNGEVEWYGEDHDDIGKIVVRDNEVMTMYGSIVYGFATYA